MGQHTPTISGDGFTTDIPNITPDFSMVGETAEMRSIMNQVTQLLSKEYSDDFDSQIGTLRDYIIEMVEKGLFTDENLGVKAIEKSMKRFDETKSKQLDTIADSLRKALEDKMNLAKMGTQTTKN